MKLLRGLGRRKLTLRARVAAFSALGVALAVVVVSLAGWWLMHERMYENLDRQLRADTAEAARAATPAEALRTLRGADQLPGTWSDDDLPVEIRRLLRLAGLPPPVVVRFLDSGGHVVSTSAGDAWLGPVTSPAARVAADGTGQDVDDVELGDETVYRVSTAPRPGGAVQVASRVIGIEGTLDDLRVLLTWVGLAGAALAGLVGSGVARASLRPVHQLTGAVETVAETQDLDSSIPVSGHDEIARLATAVNHLLTALAASKAAQQQLVEDAGHELRTPLTSLRTNVELLTYAEQQRASGRSLAADDRARLLRDLGIQAEELTTLTTELVELAAENTDPEPFGPLDLADLVHGAVIRARARWPQVVFAVTAAPAPLTGQPGGLSRVVLNLLDNAAKWSPPGGTVRVALSTRDGNADLTVADEGPGIDEQDRPKVFERFYRATAARSMPGSGLGLAIVAQIVGTHAGRVVAGAAEGGGAELRVRLPLDRFS
ncbi:two-component system, OmpR family, sensor histidine kinase MprB [Amycolatopsis tolypomycina]|uniref:histidine kinase n=1 Tax=Amycolatopsis tolypomycina TaxID=208445 RepID=A0A1H4XBW8_9PSEU|nr:HAMP domain-containing sensor histidine kinase [Amycolatopsis tolypomycina]SED03065.1 two-component system, OmpR family, sensor histidine kinase MprB [Amycolatopsis tolypomycina]